MRHDSRLVQHDDRRLVDPIEEFDAARAAAKDLVDIQVVV